MATLTKKRKSALEKVDKEKLYTLKEASNLVKEISTTNFDASVDISMRLNVDPRKANQMVRGTVSLPHGIGKTLTVLALVTPDKEEEAKAAGADYVGLDEYVEKIKGGWTDVDVIVTMPSVMGKVGALGRVLGPRGLMPNPKSGTVTMDVAKAVSDAKAGKVEYRLDKSAIMHVPIGKVSFTDEQLDENLDALMHAVVKARPAAAKGTYLRSVVISSTMGPGIKVNPAKYMMK